MLGTFLPGDCLIVTSAMIEDLCVGDVVVFRGTKKNSDDDCEWVHRVVDAFDRKFITRGDHNSYNDFGFLTNENMVGRVDFVLRDKKKRAVWNGQLGYWWARCLHLRQPLLYLLGRFLGNYYQWLREKKILAQYWHLKLSKLYLWSEEGLIIKYVLHGRTIAIWQPEQKRFDCRKPFDLVIPSPLEEEPSPTHAKLD